jgi:hypothetical protein
MSEGREVDGEEFQGWMAPMVAALNEFVRAVEDVGPRHGNLPTDGSQAMRELASEDELRERSGWENPITDTHTFGGMTLWAAADYTRSFAATFGGQRPPLYGHLALARDVLESSVVSFWLSENAIAYDERVKRGLCELIYSANEVKRLGLTSEAEQTLTEVTEWAASFDWTLRNDRGKPEVDGTKRRSVPEGIRQLLVDHEDAQLGRLLWNRLSAVTHVTWWGLMWALDLPASPSGSTGFTTVSVGTDSKKVSLQALCVLRALRVAATERITLMGWIDGEWQDACNDAEERESALLNAVAP